MSLLLPTRGRYAESLTSHTLHTAGLLPVVYLLATGRWGSYLGVGGFYLTDLMVGIAVFTFLLDSPLGDRRCPGPIALILVLAAFLALRLLDQSAFSTSTLRDFAPYAYASLSFLAACRFAESRETAPVHNLMVGALMLHMTWFGLSEAFPGVSTLMPTIDSAQQLHVFSIRPDFDTAVAGVLGAFALRTAAIAQRHRWQWTVVSAISLIEVVASTSRAGLIATMIAYILAILLSYRDSSFTSSSRILIGALAPVVLLAGILLASGTTVGVKLLTTVDPAAANRSSAASEWAQGTQDARALAWQQLVTWTSSDKSRSLVGVGFGPDFMTESGALTLLVSADTGGDTQPRSPHNFWVGTYARLGAVGLALVLLPIFGCLPHRPSDFRQIRVHRDLELALLTVVCLGVVATLGVVLESPFGAIPFWWCVGLLMARTVRSPRLVQPVGAQWTTESESCVQA